MLLCFGLAFAADLAATIGALGTLTDAEFARREALLSEVPPGPLMRALVEAPPQALRALDAPIDPNTVVAQLAAAGVPVNPHLDALDVLPPELRGALRRVQPAVARVISGKYGGSGVNIDARGRILTADHVIGTLPVTVTLPDGTRWVATVLRRDPVRDLALLGLPEATAVPRAALADAPPSVGDSVVMIGHPGSARRAPFQVDTGTIRGLRLLRDGPQPIGATAHDAMTDWGHSGSPLFDPTGHIVALHNSWNSATGMRHAVSWEAMRSFWMDCVREGHLATPPA